MGRARQRGGRDGSGRYASGFGRVEEAGSDGLRVTTLWSPLPDWLPPVLVAAGAAGVAAAVAAGSGNDGDAVVTVVAVTLVAAYFGSALVWAVVGAAGGVRQVLLLDRGSDRGEVQQSFLWRRRRPWTFDLNDVDRLYVWGRRGLPMRLTQTHLVAMGFASRRPLSMGHYHTEGEALATASPVASFLDVPMRRNEDPRERRRRWTP